MIQEDDPDKANQLTSLGNQCTIYVVNCASRDFTRLD